MKVATFIPSFAFAVLVALSAGAVARSWPKTVPFQHSEAWMRPWDGSKPRVNAGGTQLQRMPGGV
jgi:hypothetical protein